jgi:hypothetical protein
MGQTFACQFQDDVGFKWTAGQWEVTRFRVGTPFFIKMAGQDVDLESIYRALGKTYPPPTQNPLFSVTCQKQLAVHTCSGIGQVLSFNSNVLSGVLSTTLGALTKSDQNRDSISISPFTCQQM